MKKILVVCSHPDDEILGSGGTIVREIKQGSKVYILILGEGITSRGGEQKQMDTELNYLQICTENAHKVLGIHPDDVFEYDYPDNCFDIIPLLDIVKVIENIKDKIKPDVIYTHHHGDLNIDHRITFDAVMTATRPMEGETVKEIYSFEVPSSTEWAAPIPKNYFMPNVFVDIIKTIDIKLKAIKEYKSEIRPFPHPRSLDAIEFIARRWGINVGLEFAEAFTLVRRIT